MRAEPVTVTGGFNFGLKAIAKGMHAAGPHPDDAGATARPTASVRWSGLVARRARRGALGSPMSEHPLMREIAAYNEVDCRVMAEVLEWLRENR